MRKGLERKKSKTIKESSCTQIQSLDILVKLKGMELAEEEDKEVDHIGGIEVADILVIIKTGTTTEENEMTLKLCVIVVIN